MSAVRWLRAALAVPLLALALAALPARAQERIIAYDSDVVVAADGSLDVTERITVRAEGDNIRRGIYRDFPTRYKDRHGNRVVVDFDMLGVTRNGQPEPWFTEQLGNGVRINTGNDDYLDVPADYTYELHYRTTRQLGFFDDHDELYWNAIGHGWAFPIERGSVQVRFPQSVPVADMQALAYTGAQGERGSAAIATLPAPGTARWQLTAPLAPQEGLTIVLSFPKGLVAEPTRSQRAIWFLDDNRGVLAALAGLLLVVGYCFQRWRRVGRDPRGGVVIARYEVPEGHSPGGLRYLLKMAPDTRGFSADVLALAVDGQLRIEREDKLLKDAWILHRLDGRSPHRDGPLRALAGHLFPGGIAELKLEQGSASTLMKARSAHIDALKQQYQPAMFKTNAGSTAIATLIGMVAMGAAFGLSGGAGLPLIFACAGLMFVTVIAFAILVRAPTPAGRKLLDEIEGLKLYLGVAEKDDLARVQGPEPQLDAERYQRLLPYAVALDVEEAWTGKFTLAVGAAAAAAGAAAITWYRGGAITDMGSFASSVGSSLSSQIASSSSPPGSSSGGGGFSGGGGGGGGGGGR
ncbi:MAG: DUF2207 domain-containing protein [Pseudomonadota bacterium]|nr:DUF2207 domain-containing protein [Pseudomonadota bacterium]